MSRTLVLVNLEYVDYRESMNVAPDTDVAVSTVAAVIGERTRARILVSLMDGGSRSATELGALAEVGQSTVSAHLHRLEAAHLVTVRRKGKNRYYSLRSVDVASLLERLSALAGSKPGADAANAPVDLRVARTCYDHIAGVVGVALRDRFIGLGWLMTRPGEAEESYELSATGAREFIAMGIDFVAARGLRRRFAFGCLDWTDRRYHLGGSLGAAFLQLARSRKWITQDLDSRVLRVTECGRREMLARIGLTTLARLPL